MYQASAREHREVGAVTVVRHWAAGVLAGLVVRVNRRIGLVVCVYVVSSNQYLGIVRYMLYKREFLGLEEPGVALIHGHLGDRLQAVYMYIHRERDYRLL